MLLIIVSNNSGSVGSMWNFTQVQLKNYEERAKNY